MRTKSQIHVNRLLREARLSQGWSQQELADRLGVTIVTVNRWERGIQQPSPLFRLKLCTLLGKHENELGLHCMEADTDLASSDEADQEECATQAEMAVVETSKARTSPIDTLSCVGEEQRNSLPATKHTPSPASLTSLQPERPTSLRRSSLPWIRAISSERTLPGSLPFLALVVLLLVFLLGDVIFLRWPGWIFAHSSVSAEQKPVKSLPAPGQLLYTAQWSRGLDGWPVSGSCQWVNQDGGAIVTDGNNSNDILVAPYTLHISDYAIEVSIKRTGYAPWGGNAFGLVVRNGAIEGGYIAGVGVHFLPEHFFIGFLTRSSDNSSEYVSSDLARASSHLDTAWHRYRLEVRGDTITFLLDGKPVAQAHSDLHTQPGDVGIYVDGAKLSLSKFQIVALA